MYALVGNAAGLMLLLVDHGIVISTLAVKKGIFCVYMRQWECLFGSGFMCVCCTCLEMKKRTLSVGCIHDLRHLRIGFLLFMRYPAWPFSSYVYIYSYELLLL